jgi:hypothetical protein
MKIVTARPMTFPLATDPPSGAAVAITCVLPGYPFQAAAEFHGDTFIAPQRLPLRPTRRLVVLIPEAGLDESALARKIWHLASTSALQVHILGRSPDEARASAIRRRLALLAAGLRQGQVSASTSIVVGESWERAVRAVLRNGDLLVCIARHKAPTHLFRHRSLGEALATAFDAPVYLLGGLKLDRSPAQFQRMRSLAAWSLSIVILLAFAGGQIWLSQNLKSPLSPILLGLSIIAEGITLLITIEWMG